MERHDIGLTAEQVRRRVAAGAVNIQPQGLTPTAGRIYRKNILTLFNIINLTLALLLIVAGQPQNALFLGVAIVNTTLGIVQELRSKKTLDRLSILNQSAVTAMRDGKAVSLNPGEIVQDDVLLISAGGQIAADAVVLESEGLEVNEALLTGESDNIPKRRGDTVLSGSFSVAGSATVRVTAVGSSSFATALTAEAKKVKEQTSHLMRVLKGIIRVLTMVIVPIGALLFYTQYRAGGDITEALLGAAAAMTGMIPQGLVMLTGVTLTVSAVSLAKRKALVQSLPGIETLARVDVLCLDKTGTITDGTLTFEQTVLMEGYSKEEVSAAVAGLMGALRDDNLTATALRAEFGAARGLSALYTVPFSSARKWSGASIAVQGGPVSYILGAPAFVFPSAEPLPQARLLSEQGYRVLCLARSSVLLRDGTLPDDLSCMALLALSDTVRHDAPDTFRFFAGQGVTLKVISGDDPLTVSHIAAKAGIAGAERAVDMSRVTGDLTFLVEENTVFGRVSPSQKRELIRALKGNGHVTCMTGDGVNDVIAMKEADCGVAMINGSAAARSASDFVLMTSDFSAMIHILNEGRRVINNIECVAALYLLQTIYATLLSLAYIILPYPFPYVPLQMTPVGFLTVGLPSFFLALRRNYHKPRDRFVAGILEHSLPAALTVLFNILILQAAGIMFELGQGEISTMNVFCIGIVAFTLLLRISRPVNIYMGVLLSVLGAAFAALFLLGGGFFALDSLFSRNAFFYLPLAVMTPHLCGLIGGFIRRTGEWWQLNKKR
ncbi:MAG: HAD-IC family P-type ATPase [Oscillospiraceae bacterium]|jgi:cation-transporting ATPase E|nr:HAD-IC family P-type ATPase [Oscillospiraceae bacterium]